MNRNNIWLILSFVIVITLSLISCTNQKTSTPTGTSTSTTQPAPISTTTTSSVIQGKWWDKFGTPQYGGIMTVKMDQPNPTFNDLDFGAKDLPSWESLFCSDWTLDRTIQSFTTEFFPLDCYKGNLAEKWEQTDPTTVTVYLRPGIHWQNKEPVNGRELVASDVQFTYDRMLGTGSGFTEPNPMFAGAMTDIDKVVATDKYTVQFKLKEANHPLSMYQVLNCGGLQMIVIIAPEWAALGNNASDPNSSPLSDWKNNVGTGPFILSDFVSGASLTYSKNPDYWAFDERYPENRLPYVDTIKQIVLQDTSTIIAALRTARIDGLTGGGDLNWQQAQELLKTNPDIQEGWFPGNAPTLEIRVDHAPFTDIKVREALQMAIDRKAIAASIYGNTVSGVPCGEIAPQYEGWTVPYDKWPTDVQKLYSYDPTTAMQLLSDAGYPSGFTTNCVAPTMVNLALLQIIKDEFRDIGVDMTIQTMDPFAAINYAFAGKNDQMFAAGSAGLVKNPAQAILRRTTDQDRENFTHCSDPKYDDLVTRFQAATSIDEAMKLCAQADLYAIEQCWSINVFPDATPILWQPWLKGDSGEDVMGGGYYFYLSRWWLDRSLRK